MIVLGGWSVLSLPATAADFQNADLTISKIRAVGDYSGATFDNTIEVWFSTPLLWPAGSRCTEASRVYIDTKNVGLFTAAYFAFGKSRKVSINVDDSLPIRMGACEVSYLDVGLQ